MRWGPMMLLRIRTVRGGVARVARERSEQERNTVGAKPYNLTCWLS